jgi:hypothetical protein
MIISYNGTSKFATVAMPFGAATDATSVYSIFPGVKYTPNSDIQLSNGTSGAIRYNRDGVEHIMTGARGNVKSDSAGADYSKLTFEFEGLVGVISDQAVINADVSGWQDPLAITAANMDNVYVGGMANPVLQSINIDAGNTLINPDLMNQEFVTITDRKAKLTLKLLAVKVAVMDWWTKVRLAQSVAIAYSVGKTRGNIISVLMPTVQPLTIAYGDASGISTHDISGAVKPYTTGNNELIYVFK